MRFVSNLRGHHHGAGMTTDERIFGGNRVRAINTDRAGRHQFAEGVYSYALYVVDRDEELQLPQLQSYSVFVLDAPASARITVAESGRPLRHGDAVQVEAALAKIDVEASPEGPARLLIAGTKNPSGRPPGVTVTSAAEIYRVAKPWGHELWINGQHPTYALKEIAIQKGTQTSLQYHHFKQETNVLFAGSARLHYKTRADPSNDRLAPDHIGTVDLHAVSSVDVEPPVLHRLEALTDVLLYEVSTPHLDDVVRVQDDAHRPHGRIEAEHKR